MRTCLQDMYLDLMTIGALSLFRSVCLHGEYDARFLSIPDTSDLR
jgi:hypothetical protein